MTRIANDLEHKTLCNFRDQNNFVVFQVGRDFVLDLIGFKLTLKQVL